MATTGLQIRAATSADDLGIWAVIGPVIRAGDTYAVPPDLSREETLAWWWSAPHQVFVAVADATVVGTYYLQPNQRGPGSHVANCGYMTSPDAAGRGVATAMCRDSLERAAAQGFRAMQFNLVVSTNERAVALWQRLGFAVVGTIPGAYLHPTAGYVDAHVMYRRL
jgi:RimJ/RimL family protein N-acetyltransferase